MVTITIPKNLIKEKDLMLIPRFKYEGLLKRLKIIENYEEMVLCVCGKVTVAEFCNSE